MSNIFGKSGAEKRLKKFKPSDFTTGGLSGTFTPRLNKKGKPKKGQFDFDLSRSSELTQNLDALQARLGERASAFRGLRDRVSGTVGEFTRARIDAIRRAGSRTVGNLREELGRRRVLGSSFAQREIAGIESSFAAQEAEQAASGKLTEFGLEAEFINEEFASSIQSVTALIEQGNFESSLAASVATAGSAQIQANLTAAAQASAARRGGWAELIGTAAGLAFPGSTSPAPAPSGGGGSGPR